jgi:hypothetical protein
MKGRPPSRNKGLRDGYYFEVFNKGASSGIKIRKETEAEMNEAADEYRREGKSVNVLGMHKKGEWVNQAIKEAEAKAARKAAKKEKVLADALLAEMEAEALDVEISDKEPKAGKKDKAESKFAKPAPAAKVKPVAKKPTKETDKKPTKKTAPEKAKPTAKKAASKKAAKPVKAKKK